MQLLRRILPLLALPVLCASCGDPLGSSGGRAELRRNLRLWKSQEPRAYEYVVEGGCFCPPPGAARARVFDGASTSFTYVASGQPADWPGYRDMRTVDEIFAFVAEAYEGGADEVRVEYDPVWGFPRSISVDYEANTADEEVYYTVRDFARLPEPL